MSIQGLGYVGIAAVDPHAWAAFAETVVGLDVRAGGEHHDYLLRLDEHPHRGWIDGGAEDGISCIGWEVRDSAGLDVLAQRLKESGVDVTIGTDAECEDRRVSRMIHFTGPCAVRTELFSGRRLADSQFVSPLGVEFVTGDQGMGHVVMKTPYTQEAVDFYTTVLGFRLSDVADYPWGAFYFLGCNPRHHSVAFVRSHRREGAHHILFEVDTASSVGRALDRVREQQIPLMATLGKHANDEMFSFYMHSPAGFGVEIGAEGRRIDEATWVSRTYSADIWGHHPVDLPPAAPHTKTER